MRPHQRWMKARGDLSARGLPFRGSAASVWRALAWIILPAKSGFEPLSLPESANFRIFLGFFCLSPVGERTKFAYIPARRKAFQNISNNERWGSPWQRRQQQRANRLR